MDSMRSLNSSLPSSNPSRSAPREQLLQAFRTAALSVTNLYKSAATDQANSRQTGYQDALEDLLRFLDEENLGLQDGEGWRVRQWATAKFDGSTTHQLQSEAEEEHSESETLVRTSSPAHEQAEESTPTQAEQITEPQSAEQSEQTNDASPVFHFTANTQTDLPMQTDGSSSTSTPIRVEVLNQNSRSRSRPNNSRHNTRSSQRDFTFTAGTKRKIHFPDFFDISNMNDRREGPSGGNGTKKGRFV